MSRYTHKAWAGKQLFIGIDMHRSFWHVTILSEEDLILFTRRISGTWEALLEV